MGKAATVQALITTYLHPTAPYGITAVVVQDDHHALCTQGVITLQQYRH